MAKATDRANAVAVSVTDPAEKKIVEEYEKRLELAQHEWARLKANDSLECRNCHNFDYMDFTRQSLRAAEQHSTSLASGEKTCIDCHKGIAHHKPEGMTEEDEE